MPLYPMPPRPRPVSPCPYSLQPRAEDMAAAVAELRAQVQAEQSAASEAAAATAAAEARAAEQQRQIEALERALQDRDELLDREAERSSALQTEAAALREQHERLQEECGGMALQCQAAEERCVRCVCV